MTSFVEHSRVAFGSGLDRSPTVEEIACGALQRIATATEAMATEYNRLIRERDSARRSVDYWRERAERAERRLSATKGVVTRLKAARSDAARSEGA